MTVRTTRPCAPSRALSDWAAICVYGRLQAWSPRDCEGGEGSEAADWSVLVHVKIESGFWALFDYRKRWRAMAKAVLSAKRSPTRGERDEWRAFARTFRVWWEVNGLPEPPKPEKR